LNGCLALPGLIDVHVHLRGQQQAYEEDFATGTAAAVAGGITSVLDMPNNQPITMDSASLRERIQAAKQDIVANVGFFSAFPKDFREIEKIVSEGGIGFKLFLTAQIGGLNIDDDEALQEAFKQVGEFGIPVAVHAEDKNLVETAIETEKKLGNEDVDAYLKAHTPRIEAKAVERILKIAGKARGQIHFCHISSEKALTLMQKARQAGYKVSCEVTPHHLLLTSKDLKRQGSLLLTDPPVRSLAIVEKLWKAVKKGPIDIVASDHAPHLLAEKQTKSIWNVKPGIPGLETMLPLILTKVNEGWLTIHDVVKIMAERPSEIFHLHSNGALKSGYSANITVIDMHRRVKIDVGKFFSKAEYSPFEGWEVKGVPTKTFVNGRMVMDEGELLAKGGVGKILRSEA
jgi:dihydroorotase